MNLRSIKLSERVLTQEYILHDSTYVKFLNWQNYFMVKKKIRLILSVGVELTEKEQEGTLWGNGNILNPARKMGYIHVGI